MKDLESRTSRDDHPARLALTGLWFGLATGIGEIVLLGVKKLYLRQFIRVGPEILWMTPLADAVLFVAVAALLLPVRLRTPSLIRPRLICASLAFLAFLSLLLMYYPIQLYAKLLLAAGLAAAIVRVIERWPGAFKALVRRTAPWMMTFVLVSAAGVASWRSLTYRQALKPLPAAAAGAPNVLLVVLDTVRAQNLSLYGYQRPTTPNLDRWAAAGVVFDRAIAPASWTLPSHASMFTGRWPHELSTSWEAPLDARYPTLAEILSTRGYATAGFVANTYYCGYELGLSRGFAHYEDYVVSPRELLISSSFARSVVNARPVRRVLGYHDNIPRRDAAAINAQFLSWLSSVPDRPFFAFLNYFDAHEAYLPPRPFTEKFGPDLPRRNDLLSQEPRRSLRDDWRERPAQEIKTEIDMYDGAIAYIDAQLNALFLDLQRRGVLDNTLVIVTSDHGEQFGEHGLFLHANSLYQPLIHVPLMISFPARAPRGQRVASTVSLRDLPATVLDLVGLQEASALPGRSLARYWSDTSRQDEPVLAEVGFADWAKTWFPWYPTAKGNMQSLSDEHYHYIRNGDGQEELYALDADPGEQHNVARLEENRERLGGFRAQLKNLLAGNARSKSAGPGE